MTTPNSSIGSYHYRDRNMHFIAPGGHGERIKLRRDSSPLAHHRTSAVIQHCFGELHSTAYDKKPHSTRTYSRGPSTSSSFSYSSSTTSPSLSSERTSAFVKRSSLKLDIPKTTMKIEMDRRDVGIIDTTPSNSAYPRSSAPSVPRHFLAVLDPSILAIGSIIDSTDPQIKSLLRTTRTHQTPLKQENPLTLKCIDVNGYPFISSLTDKNDELIFLAYDGHEAIIHFLERNYHITLPYGTSTLSGNKERQELTVTFPNGSKKSYWPSLI